MQNDNASNKLIWNGIPSMLLPNLMLLACHHTNASLRMEDSDSMDYRWCETWESILHTLMWHLSIRNGNAALSYSIYLHEQMQQTSRKDTKQKSSYSSWCCATGHLPILGQWSNSNATVSFDTKSTKRGYWILLSIMRDQIIKKQCNTTEWMLTKLLGTTLTYFHLSSLRLWALFKAFKIVLHVIHL